MTRSRLERVPQLAELDAIAAAHIDRADPWTFLRHAPDLLACLAPPFAADLFAAELAALRDDGDHRPEGIDGARFTLLATERVSLQLSLVTAPVAPGLETSARHQAIAVLGPGRVTIETFRLPPPHDLIVLDRTRRLVPTGATTLAPGGTRVFRAPEDVYRVIGVEGTSVLAVLSSALATRVTWRFDPVRLSPTLALAADARSSRLEFACRLLAELGDTRARDTLARLTTHPDHFVRWAAISALGRLDPEAGTRTLRTALDDVHPQVRGAAAATLAKLEAEADMAITFSVDHDDKLSLAEYVDYVERHVDPDDLDSVAASAPQLRALANDRRFLTERINDELHQWETFQRQNPYTPQSFFLAERPGFLVRAVVWEPTRGTREAVELQKRVFDYAVPHDHNFSFLTVGYWGSGYETTIFDYDRRGLEGVVGEPVELRFLERTTLSQGKVMLYRACRDVHLQAPPRDFSISVNLILSSPTTRRTEQYLFDLNEGAIAGYGASEIAKRESLCRMASVLGDGRTVDLLDTIAHAHACPRTRASAHAAWSALIDRG